MSEAGRVGGIVGQQALGPAEEELREFSYIVSHDLATSFRHLSQFSKFLVQDLNTELSSSQRQYADHITAAADKCHAMIEQLLVFSRIQQEPLAYARADARRLVDSVLLRLSGEMRGAEIGIRPLGEVVADPQLLTLAVTQLLDNALKFRRAGQGGHVQLDAEAGPSVWMLRVVDNGIGVPADLREKAFRMFSQLNAEGAYPGVGAGLAIARRIARRHGGEVRFVDWPDGTCVELTLPLAPEGNSA